MKKTPLLASIFCCTTWLKINIIVGSCAARFSALAFAGPIIGLQATLTQLIISFGGFGFWMLFHGNTVNPMILVYHVPSFMGMAYSNLVSSNPISTSQNNHTKRIIAALIPVLCIIMFCTHPVGAHAWPYALLWIFPTLFPFWKQQSFFWYALASTMTCHAVGSVLWLYTHHLTAHAWLNLLPTTIAERLSIATFSTGIYAGFCTAKASRIRENWNKVSLWIKLKISPYRL